MTIKVEDQMSHVFVSDPAWGPPQGMCSCGATKPRGVQYARWPVERWFEQHIGEARR